MNDIRSIRNQLLAACDWTQLPDAPLSRAEKARWKAYRQALRDVTDGVTDPAAIIWPERPDNIN